MSQHLPLKGQTGLKRIFNAFNYSMSGFKSAFKNEAAFRQIIYLNLVLLPISFLLDISKVEHILLIIVGLFAIMVELLNSAIEAVVDRISLDRHPLAKIAKDMGSAAQFMALSIITITWIAVIFL
ncbi:diacylglycerol kinase [Acinetobacter sp. B5B]|uniref:diacylglycerol kinase n=1 Tax=Acinetobacter baretiae TaxID=2605383 RepID=UPI0018C2D24C|nr:diacylglycerol kinase [Acinetobacter baretiae]MBF7683412.1 diacylglycerol kinase [Acinetobacter baretiae]MBF7685779.1 diacylglycerol kinase [Acinetobacter baretiae]